MALAGHELTVHAFESTQGGAAPTSGNYDEIDGINNVSFGPTRDQLESTDFMDTTGARTRFGGLRDGTVSLSGDYEAADTGQGHITSAFEGASDAVCWIQILWDGTSGHHVKCVVDSYTIEASFDGKVEFSAELSFTGLPAANP